MDALKGNNTGGFSPQLKGPKCSCPLCTATMERLCKRSHQRHWQAWQTSLSGGRVHRGGGREGGGRLESVSHTHTHSLVCVEQHTTPQFIWERRQRRHSWGRAPPCSHVSGSSQPWMCGLARSLSCLCVCVRPCVRTITNLRHRVALLKASAP